MVYLDPFSQVTNVSFKKKTWMLTNNGEFIGVEPDGEQADKVTTWPGSIAGMAVAGKRVFAAEFSGANSVHVNDYVDGTNQTFIGSPVIDTLNDVATDGAARSADHNRLDASADSGPGTSHDRSPIDRPAEPNATDGSPTCRRPVTRACAPGSTPRP